MNQSWFEELRFPLESIQNLQKGIVSEMLALKDNPKQKSIAEHRINNFMEMIQQKSKNVLNFLKQETAMKKQQTSIIQGHKSIKVSDKVKLADVIWQNFYQKSREIKQYYKKSQNNEKTTQNTVQYFRRVAFMPPYKEPQFSLQQNKGKYVDMHHVYLQYINLCTAMQQKQGLKLHDYLWFLQNMDKFDDFALNKKMKYHYKYLTYLKLLNQYLESFIKRSRPLFDFNQFIKNITKVFNTKFDQQKIHGWQPQHDNLQQSQWQFCNICEKLYIRQKAYIDHLVGKNHLKNLKQKQQINMNSQQNIQNSLQKQQQSKQQFKQSHNSRKKQLAYQQFKAIKYRQQLANVIYDTMNLVRKKQTRGYEQIDQINANESQQSQDQQAPIYNPKNLPLGWDGKPIPYWLYKLHGLGIQYKCQICGNFSYWGRRAFQMHFQEWRHTYGMKCLKIPNTIHFKDVTTISDALALHQKLMRESQESQFRPDVDQEFQDNQGNILNKRTYTDMKKQGLIDD